MRKIIEFIAKVFGEPILFKADVEADKMILSVEIEQLKKQNLEMRNDLRELCLNADPLQMSFPVRLKWHQIFNLEADINNVVQFGDYDKARREGIYSMLEDKAATASDLKKISIATIYTEEEINEFIIVSGLTLKKCEKALLIFSSKNVSMQDVIMLYMDNGFTITDSGIDMIS